MDDGRCLLDVIGDPIALDEFLQNESRQQQQQLQLNLYNDATDNEQNNFPSSHQLLSPTDLILPQSGPQPSYHQTSVSTSHELDLQAVSSTTHGDDLAGTDSSTKQNVAGASNYDPRTGAQTQFVQLLQSSQVQVAQSSVGSSAIPVATIKPYAETPPLQVLNSGSNATGAVVEDSTAQRALQGQAVSQVQEQPVKAAPATAQTPGSTLHYLAPNSTIIARNAAGQPVTLSSTMLQAVQSMTQSLGQNQAVGQPIQIIPSNQIIQQGGALPSGRVMTLGQVIIGGAAGQQITLVQAPPKATPKVPAMQTIIAAPQVIKGPANIQPKPAGGTTTKTPISIRPVQISIPTQALQAGTVPQNYQIITHPTLGQPVMVSTASQDQTQQPQVVPQLLQPAAATQQENNNSSTQQTSFRLVQHPTSGQILQIPAQAVQQGTSSTPQQQQQSFRVVQQQSTGQPLQVAAAHPDGNTPVQQTYQIVNQPTTGQASALTKTLAHSQGTVTSQTGIIMPQQAVVLQNQTVLTNSGTSQKVHPVITIGTSQGNIIVMTQSQPVASTTTTQSGNEVAPEPAISESQTESASSKTKKPSRPSKKKKTSTDIAPKTGVVEKASPLQTSAQAIQRVPTHQNPATVVLQTDFTITPNAQGIPTMTVSQAGSQAGSQLSVAPQVTQSVYQVSHNSVSVQQKQADSKAQALLDADQQQFQLYQKVLKLQQEKQQAQQVQQQQQQAGQQVQPASQSIGQVSQGAQQALQQALRLSQQQAQQQAQLSAQQAQLKAQLALHQAPTGQQLLKSAPGQSMRQEQQQQQQQQQGNLTANQQQAQQTVEQVLHSSQMAYTSQQQLLSMSSQGLQLQTPQAPLSQPQTSQAPLSQPQTSQSSKPSPDQQAQLQQQQQPLQQPKPGSRQMTFGQALQALINQSGKGQQITSQQQLQQFIQANPQIVKQLQVILQQQKQQQQQQQQLQLQQDSQSAQDSLLQASQSQSGDPQALNNASTAQQSQGTSQLGNINNNSDQSLNQTQIQPSSEQGFQVLQQTRVNTVPQQQIVNSQGQRPFGGLGSAAIHLARMRQQKIQQQQQQLQLQQQQQSSTLSLDQQMAVGSANSQQTFPQSQAQQQISQVTPGQQSNLEKQDLALGQLASVVQTPQSLDQASQGSLQVSQGNIFQIGSQSATSAPAPQMTVHQQLQQQRQLSAATAAATLQAQQAQTGVNQASQGGHSQLLVNAPAGSQQLQSVEQGAKNAAQQGVQVQQQGLQQQQQGMLVQQGGHQQEGIQVQQQGVLQQQQGMQVQTNVQLQGVSQQQQQQVQQGVQMQQQPQGGQQGSSSGISQLSSSTANTRQQVIQQISIQTQKQLQVIQSHIRQVSAIVNPTEQQKNMLAQLQSLQQKIVQQARQQLAQYLASGGSRQQKSVSASQVVTAATPSSQQSQVLSQSTPAFSSAQQQSAAAGSSQVLSQSLGGKDTLQQQQQQQQLASAVATAAAIQASPQGAAQAGGPTTKQQLMVKQLQEHLKKMTPEQLQQFSKHHQTLLLKMQAQGRMSGNQPQLQQITQKVITSSPAKKNIAIKPAIMSQPVAPRESPKEILPKQEKEKHKHKSKHKDKDKEKDKDKDKEKDKEKEKDKLFKKPKATPVAKQLAQDQASVERTDTKRPFTVPSKAIKRLLPFHLFQDNTATDKQLSTTDEIFEAKCIGLMEKKQRMLSKYQLLLYNESMRLRPSAEVVMIERMFLSDERNKLEADKKLTAASQELLNSVAPVSNNLTVSIPSSNVGTTTTVSSSSIRHTSISTTIVKAGQKIDTPILRELVTSPSIPQNLLSPKIAAVLTEAVASKMASTRRSLDSEGSTTARENGSLESSNSESGDSVKNGGGGDGAGSGSPRLPPKKRKIDMSAYLIDEQVSSEGGGNIENHVKLKLKRKPAGEIDPEKMTQHPGNKVPPAGSDPKISLPSNQRRMVPNRRASFHEAFLKSIGMEGKAKSNSDAPTKEDLTEDKEMEDEAVDDYSDEDDEKISVVDLQEQMECAINSILDLQRQESLSKSPVPKLHKPLDKVRTVQPPVPQAGPSLLREVQELGSDGMNFDDQSALSELDFESHPNSIEYDLEHMGDTFPFDADDQTQFMPEQNADIFHTDISSSSYPPAPVTTVVDASPPPGETMNDDTESSLNNGDTYSAVDKQYPSSGRMQDGYGNNDDDSSLLDESSVVAQFQNELSMLQSRQAVEEQATQEEFLAGGASGDANAAETDPDLEAAVNSILF